MGVQVAAVASTPRAYSSSSASSSSAAIATSSRCALLGGGCISLPRTQPWGRWSVGLMRPCGLRRATGGSIEGTGSDGGDDGEFLWRIQEQPSGGCGWPASVERSASSVGLPLSLRMLKRKMQQERRWDERLLDCCAASSARAAVGRAFSSMVLIIRELQSFTLQALLYEDLRGVLARVHGDMHASFVWLFQHIFSGTPALMVSLMLLLTNFTVYSMGHSVAAAVTVPPPQPNVAAVTVVDTHHSEQPHPWFDQASVKTFSIGRTASVGGNSGGGGGKARPVAGATGDDRSDDSSYRQSRAVPPQGVSPAKPVGTGAEKAASDAVAAEDEDELDIWERVVAEASKMQAAASAEALMDPDLLGQLVAPVEAELETEDCAEYARTEQRYEQAVSEDPNNSLLLANFAQFLYLVQRDHDRAEHYFKRAVRTEPADAEALSRYATFLWKVRDNLAAAEDTYQEAIAADPGNAHHAASYAHFLWNTGGDDTCYPLD